MYKRQAFHGAAGATALAATAISRFHQMLPGASGIVHVTNPDQYRGIHGPGIDPYLDELRASVASSTNGEVAGFIFEPVQGYGGVIPLPSEYVRAAAALTRESGGVVISDEVQTGVGRTGAHFFGFMEHDVVPDMVVMAKGIGNGFPLSVVIVRREIAEAMTSRVFMSTMGSNPTTSAAGRGVLAALEHQGLQENARVVGEHAIGLFRELQEKYEVVGDVRGRGLMIGMELVEGADHAPARKLIDRLVTRAYHNGLLLLSCGVSTLRFMPPLCVSSDEVEEAVQILRTSLDEALQN